MKFVFRFKRRGDLFWKKREVIGYKPMPEMDRMILFSEDGSIEEIPEWAKNFARLGGDWVIAMQKKMEKDSGTSVPLNVN